MQHIALLPPGLPVANPGHHFIKERTSDEGENVAKKQNIAMLEVKVLLEELGEIPHKLKLIQTWELDAGLPSWRKDAFFVWTQEVKPT